MSSPVAYREELFQWIWNNLEFDCSRLETVCGKSLSIVNTGQWNHGAGPDFLGAHIQIDGREWYGSVEIHKKAGEWFLHEHHQDENFNSVILHVVFDDASYAPAQTSDGHEPFTLILKSYLTKEVHKLLEEKHQKGIACGGNVSFISQEAFEKQVALAHQEYLEYKIEELLEFYDASLPVSQAWKKCLIAGIYTTLGIPANKQQMAELAEMLFSEMDCSENSESFLEHAQKVAFGNDSGIDWVFHGMRPASRPGPRVAQAAALHEALLHIPFSDFLKSLPEHSWAQLVACLDSSHLPGSSRLSLIKQIVFLPGLYLLGDLLHSKSLKQEVLKMWRASGAHVPEEMKKPFKKAGFKLNSSTNRIGLAHQYKRYCQQKNCHQCEVFKKAIRS